MHHINIRCIADIAFIVTRIHIPTGIHIRHISQVLLWASGFHHALSPVLRMILSGCTHGIYHGVYNVKSTI